MYVLVVNDEQAEVLAKALDLFSRIGCGQIEELLRHPTIQKKLYELIDSDKYLDTKNEAEILIGKLKKLLVGFDLNASQSITIAHEPNRVAYDIFQVLRNRIAWFKRPAGGMEVDFHEPIKWSEQPLPEVKRE
jgi:hypothetical protein